MTECYLATTIGRLIFAWGRSHAGATFDPTRVSAISLPQ